MIETQMSKSERGHKYKIGEQVSISAGFGYARKASGAYQVVALLPSNGAHFQYRLRSSEEQFERVAAENELARRAVG